MLNYASSNLQTIEFDLTQTIVEDKANFLEMEVLDALNRTEAARVVFINNAGVISPIGKIGTIAPSSLSASLAVNVIAPMALCSAAVRYVLSVGAKLFVMNISSGAAARPIPGWGSYCAGKAAARSLFEVMNAEWKPKRVLVEHIDPGVLDTKMQMEICSASQEQFPLVESFQNLKTQNLLKSPDDAAKALLARIEEYFKE